MKIKAVSVSLAIEQGYNGLVVADDKGRVWVQETTTNQNTGQVNERPWIELNLPDEPKERNADEKKVSNPKRSR